MVIRNSAFFQNVLQEIHDRDFDPDVFNQDLDSVTEQAHSSVKHLEQELNLLKWSHEKEKDGIKGRHQNETETLKAKSNDLGVKIRILKVAATAKTNLLIHALYPEIGDESTQTGKEASVEQSEADASSDRGSTKDETSTSAQANIEEQRQAERADAYEEPVALSEMQGEGNDSCVSEGPLKSTVESREEQAYLTKEPSSDTAMTMPNAKRAASDDLPERSVKRPKISDNIDLLVGKGKQRLSASRARLTAASPKFAERFTDEDSECVLADEDPHTVHLVIEILDYAADSLQYKNLVNLVAFARDHHFGLVIRYIRHELEASTVVDQCQLRHGDAFEGYLFALEHVSTDEAQRRLESQLAFEFEWQWKDWYHHETVSADVNSIWHAILTRRFEIIDCVALNISNATVAEKLISFYGHQSGCSNLSAASMSCRATLRSALVACPPLDELLSKEIEWRS